MNRIRESLGMVVRNSSAAGLRQPHLERTRLCELRDAELDPVYVTQRDALRDTVRQLARPKRVNGQVLWRLAKCIQKYRCAATLYVACVGMQRALTSI